MESNQIKTTIESNQMKIVSRIELKTVTRKTADADDGDHGSGPDAEMGGLITRRCAHVNCDGGGDAWGLIHIHIRIRIRICIRIHRVATKWEGFHVTGTRSGSLGASLVLADWQVRVLMSSGLVDRPSDCLYVRTITLSGCTEKRPHCKCYSIQVSVRTTDVIKILIKYEKINPPLSL